MPDDRTYIKLHDGMPGHPKVRGLSDKAFRALIRAWCYCSEYLTDGVVVSAVARDFGPKRVWDELVAGHLAESAPGGYLMHDYLEHQRSAAQVAELKRKRAEAGRRGGKAKASAKQVLEQTPSKSVPETDTEAETDSETSFGGDSHVSSGLGDEPPRCPKHQSMRREDVPDCWACGQRREAWEAAKAANAAFDRPEWCGECNEWTRLIDSEDDDTPSRRCPTCHPLAQEAS